MGEISLARRGFLIGRNDWLAGWHIRACLVSNLIITIIITPQRHRERFPNVKIAMREREVPINRSRSRRKCWNLFAWAVEDGKGKNDEREMN